MEPLLTVVIPVRNRAHLVGRTLQSLADQTVQPAAIVLVDNGSTDSSVEVLRSWAEGRPNVEILSEPRPGAACARNAGLERVQTPYVLFFDSDDQMPPRHIEEVAAALRANNLPQILEFESVFVNPAGKEKHSPLRSGDELTNHIFHATLATQRYAVSTELIRRIGGWNEALPGWNDLELGVRLLAARPTLAKVRLSSPVRIFTHADSITGNDFSSKAGQWERALDFCEQALADFPRHRRLINYRRAILAGHYRREGHPEQGRGLARGRWMRFIATYTAAGGRGVAKFAIVEKFR